MTEITPEMERLARLSLSEDVENVTAAMIQAYEDIISINPDWKP